MRLTIIGPPGAGKGTQASIISEHFGIPTISTGATLRAEIKSGSELGVLAKSLIDDGDFVPNDVINPIVQERIAKEDCADGFILDGYPRDVEQAKVLLGWDNTINLALYLNVSENEVINRLAGRRVCSDCGATYHIVHQPSTAGDLCEVCGGKLIMRKDDRPETILKRLQTYQEVTFPLIEFYKEQGMLVEVADEGSIDKTAEAVLRALEEQQ